MNLTYFLRKIDVRFSSPAHLQMYLRNTLSLLCATLLLVGCAGSPHTATSRVPQTDAFCDNYLVYDMCVRDMDGNGEVDVMYFADTQEIFMLTEEYYHRDIGEFTLHRCVQVMDASVQKASSELLYIDQETSTLQKAQVKSRLMLDYAKYYPRINRCMNSTNVVHLNNPESSFGDEDFEDLPEEWH